MTQNLSVLTESKAGEILVHDADDGEDRQRTLSTDTMWMQGQVQIVTPVIQIPDPVNSKLVVVGDLVFPLSRHTLATDRDTFRLQRAPRKPDGLVYVRGAARERVRRQRMSSKLGLDCSLSLCLMNQRTTRTCPLNTAPRLTVS